ncbi:hypothetical protein [Parachitinimonas caeni]|uniref:Uncharacterized protein n=1 Tax=Parachitinimonas caeni TaxID=3031301 RepID=A0ABT7E696_9NEIS|nr:hypothetical protein [Parachitinimonas caeni]MDK2126447.1 hypothetical protein [Parachitinimonas caeni]
MLLSFADRVVIAVGAESVSAVYLKGWGRRRVAEARFALKVHDGVPDFAELATWLADCKARQLEVVLSSAWVRFAVLSWQPALSSEAVSLDFASSLFSEQYGDTSANWQITLSPLRPGHSRVASAIDTRWLAALQALADQRKLKLVSVRPLLASVFNRVADKLAGEALLAVVEPRRLALIQVRNGEWVNLYNRMLPEPWERRLPGLITQASAALDALTTPVFIAAPVFERPELGRLSATWLRLPPQRGFDPRSDREWALCLGC